MNKFYSSKLFNYFTIVVVTGLCVLINKFTVINFHNFNLPKTNPQYNATDIVINSYNQQGKLAYKFISANVIQYPNNNRMYFTKTTATAYYESSNYVFSSNNGWFDYTQQLIYLNESVVAVVTKPKEQPIILSGDNININIATNIFSSKALFHIIQGNSIIETHGFIYNNDKKELHLLAKVRIVYANK
jgi:LPS export ABC transporter protein LptC